MRAGTGAPRTRQACEEQIADDLFCTLFRQTGLMPGKKPADIHVRSGDTGSKRRQEIFRKWRMWVYKFLIRVKIKRIADRNADWLQGDCSPLPAAQQTHERMIHHAGIYTIQVRQGQRGI